MINWINELYSIEEENIDNFLKEKVYIRGCTLLFSQFYKTLYLLNKKQFTDFNQLNNLLKAMYSKFSVDKNNDVSINLDMIYEIYYEVVIKLKNDLCKDILLQIINLYNENNFIELYENFDESKKEYVIELSKNKMEYNFFRDLYKLYNLNINDLSEVEDTNLEDISLNPIPIFDNLPMTDSNYIPESVEKTLDPKEALNSGEQATEPKDIFTFPNPINPDLPMVDIWYATKEET